MIVDTETHPLLFGRYAPNNGNKTLIKHYTWCEHSPELLVAEMDNAGVDKAFLISYDAEDIQFPEETKGYTLEDYAGGRKYSLRGLRQFPDRFWWFNTVKDPNRYDAAALVAKDFAEGAVGIKLFPCYIQCHLNDPGLIKVFETVRKHKGHALVSFQSWRDGKIPFATYMEETAEMLARFPEVNFALMQAGCVDPLKPEIEPVLDLVRRFPNCYLSTGYCGELWDDGTEYPYANWQGRIKTLVQGVGADRVMWGTDWPWFEHFFKYQQSVNSVRKHAHYMSETDKAFFLGNTAARFMGVAP